MTTKVKIRKTIRQLGKQRDIHQSIKAWGTGNGAKQQGFEETGNEVAWKDKHNSEKEGDTLL